MQELLTKKWTEKISQRLTQILVCTGTADSLDLSIYDAGVTCNTGIQDA
jgi:hypothetical protein